MKRKRTCSPARAPGKGATIARVRSREVLARLRNTPFNPFEISDRLREELARLEAGACLQQLPAFGADSCLAVRESAC